VDGPRHGCEEIIIIIISVVSRPAVSIVQRQKQSVVEMPRNGKETRVSIESMEEGSLYIHGGWWRLGRDAWLNMSHPCTGELYELFRLTIRP
jgi:hypothetical protein